MTWDWETIPQYLDSLQRAPKGINCIQYMPTASLMIYVMGLEAAKTRPATEAERAEMRRLLNEGMDAGLCGFSIQRLGKHSAQADYDGQPMVTDTMCDEDILNLARVLAERDEGFIEITQATGQSKTTSRSWRSWPRPRSARFCSRRSPRAPAIPRSIARASTGCTRRARRVCPFSARRAPSAADSLSPLRIGICTIPRPAWRDMTIGTKEEKTAKMKDPTMRAAVKSDEQMAILDKIAPGIGGRLVKLIVSWVEDKPELEKYVGKTLGQIGRKKASIQSM